VMIRGIERSPIFKDDQDRQDFVSRTGILAQETGIQKALGSNLQISVTTQQPQRSYPEADRWGPFVMRIVGSCNNTFDLEEQRRGRC
jgi:hypothetical protein